MSEAKMPLTVPREFVRSPGRFNPNVWILLSAFVFMALSVLGYFRWDWYPWLCFSLSVLSLHLAGTVIHDASHHSAHPNRVVNAVMGHASALLLGFSFPVFARVHMQHHAHVNDPENDPDHFVSTCGPLWLIAPRFMYHEFFFFRRKLWRKYELLEWVLARFSFGAIVFCGIKFGFIGYLMNYWFTPALVVGIALGLFFDYLPHRPFRERDRWKNSRVYPGSLLNLLIMGQNYHLVHHLWPSIPWYRYEAAYYATRPLLEAKGSPQCLGILQSPKDFWNFVYDLFIGVRWGHAETAIESTAHPPIKSELQDQLEAEYQDDNRPNPSGDLRSPLVPAEHVSLKASELFRVG